MTLTVVNSTRAVLAERLRRTLKARVRKSVGSIPTDCIFVHVVFVLAFLGCAAAGPNLSGARLTQSVE
jgi:hypothetical protein